MELVGEGNSKVYAKNARVVIKKIAKRALSASAVREIATLLALKKDSHPHVLRLVRVSFDRGDLELERGQTSLYDYKKQVQRVPSHVVKMFTQQIRSGMAFLHGIGILHQDLKLENVLLFSGGRVKLADFDLACSVSCKNPIGYTIHYKAPEILRFNLKRGRMPTNLLKCEAWSFAMTFLRLWMPHQAERRFCVAEGGSDDKYKAQLNLTERVFASGDVRAKIEAVAGRKLSHEQWRLVRRFGCWEPAERQDVAHFKAADWPHVSIDEEEDWQLECHKLLARVADAEPSVRAYPLALQVAKCWRRDNRDQELAEVLIAAYYVASAYYLFGCERKFLGSDEQEKRSVVHLAQKMLRNCGARLHYRTLPPDGLAAEAVANFIGVCTETQDIMPVASLLTRSSPNAEHYRGLSLV